MAEDYPASLVAPHMPYENTIYSTFNDVTSYQRNTSTYGYVVCRLQDQLLSVGVSELHYLLYLQQ